LITSKTVLILYETRKDVTIMTINTIEFTSYRESVPALMDQLSINEIIKTGDRILVKPNLVNATPHPVTTPAVLCGEIIKWLRDHFDNPLVIAEGTGDINKDTMQVFEELGYNEISMELDVPLVDLNEEGTVLLTDTRNRIFPEFQMPLIAMDSYIISVPVLKAHSLARVTGTLKNMMGFAPPRFYQADSHWKKSEFHKQMQQSIRELNRFRTPDLTIMDATIGLAQYHLGGPECEPPVNMLMGGSDPLELDREAARLLGFDWTGIPHLV